tara:strand:+ start:2990 stop:3472 length:483 start_codon:yes stop_codon:yes gene_type:complete
VSGGAIAATHPTLGKITTPRALNPDCNSDKHTATNTDGVGSGDNVLYTLLEYSSMCCTKNAGGNSLQEYKAQCFIICCKASVNRVCFFTILAAILNVDSSAVCLHLMMPAITVVMIAAVTTGVFFFRFVSFVLFVWGMYTPACKNLFPPRPLIFIVSCCT